jgi:hypothetical protein
MGGRKLKEVEYEGRKEGRFAPWSSGSEGGSVTFLTSLYAAYGKTTSYGTLRYNVFRSVRICQYKLIQSVRTFQCSIFRTVRMLHYKFIQSVGIFQYKLFSQYDIPVQHIPVSKDWYSTNYCMNYWVSMNIPVQMIQSVRIF